VQPPHVIVRSIIPSLLPLNVTASISLSSFHISQYVPWFQSLYLLFLFIQPFLFHSQSLCLSFSVWLKYVRSSLSWVSFLNLVYRVFLVFGFVLILLFIWWWYRDPFVCFVVCSWVVRFFFPFIWWFLGLGYWEPIWLAWLVAVWNLKILFFLVETGQDRTRSKRLDFVT